METGKRCPRWKKSLQKVYSQQNKLVDLYGISTSQKKMDHFLNKYHLSLLPYPEMKIHLEWKMDYTAKSKTYHSRPPDSFSALKHCHIYMLVYSFNI